MSKRMHSLVDDGNKSMVDSTWAKRRCIDEFSALQEMSAGSFVVQDDGMHVAPPVLDTGTMIPCLSLPPHFSYKHNGGVTSPPPMTSNLPYLPQFAIALPSGASHGPRLPQETRPYTLTEHVEPHGETTSDLVSFLLANSKRKALQRPVPEVKADAPQGHAYTPGSLYHLPGHGHQVALRRLLLEEEQKRHLYQQPGHGQQMALRRLLLDEEQKRRRQPSLFTETPPLLEAHNDKRLVNVYPSHCYDTLQKFLCDEQRLTSEPTPRHLRKAPPVSSILPNNPKKAIDSSSQVMLPTTLAHPNDQLLLSSHQCFLRQQIEVFQATQIDTTSNTRGRNKRISIGQVGIRCRFCARSSKKQASSVYYPASTMGLYQAAQNMSAMHLQCGLCTFMPDAIKTHFADLIPTKTKGSLRGRAYWSTTAKSLGLVDTDEGIRFRPSAGSSVSP